MTVLTVSYYQRTGLTLGLTFFFLTCLSACGSGKHGSTSPLPENTDSVIPSDTPEPALQDPNPVINPSVKTLIFPADSHDSINPAQRNFKFAAFNIENFGDGPDAAFVKTRRERVQQFLDDHFQDVDVLAAEEIKDPQDFEKLVAPRFSCYGPDAGRNFRAQHVLVCLRQGLSFKVAPTDDNFLIEEIASGDLRPAVHGIITDETQKTNYFYFIAAHLKAMPGPEFSQVRLKQAEILADYLAKSPLNLPQIIAGDFNTHDDDLKEITQIFSDKVADLVYVGNNLNKTYVSSEDSGSKLDHFWASDVLKKSASIKVTSLAPCSTNLPSEEAFRGYKDYISDHCPIFMGLESRER